MSQQKIDTLLAAYQNVLQNHPLASPEVEQEIQQLQRLFAPLPTLTGNLQESDHAILNSYSDIIVPTDLATRRLFDAIIPALSILPWTYSYAPRSDAPDLKDRIAFAEIIGPDAPYHSDHIGFGLTLIAPYTLYPLHWHPAVELYHVVAGSAQWTLGNVERTLPPGTFILHPSRAVHAMRTGKEPLLAVYTWSGADIVTTSQYT